MANDDKTREEMAAGRVSGFFRTNEPTPVLAPSLHSLQVLSAAKAVCADAIVGCAEPMTFMLPPAAGCALTT